MHGLMQDRPLLISSLMKAVWIFIWGPTVLAWFAFEALVSFCAQFHHANIDFPDRIERPLSWLIVTTMWRWSGSRASVES